MVLEWNSIPRNRALLDRDLKSSWNWPFNRLLVHQKPTKLQLTSPQMPTRIEFNERFVKSFLRVTLIVRKQNNWSNYKFGWLEWLEYVKNSSNHFFGWFWSWESRTICQIKSLDGLSDRSMWKKIVKSMAKMSQINERLSQEKKIRKTINEGGWIPWRLKKLRFGWQVRKNSVKEYQLGMKSLKLGEIIGSGWVSKKFREFKHYLLTWRFCSV